ncbi:hypothetical protein GGS26DRAFT_549445 [Hypomontagnella submonticulosa]|nr:hypothetical protein GGS26DRAFT_549445 [Hypomontagnella submonticulosa]
MSRNQSSTLLDRHNRAIAEILKHFNGMINAATEPMPDSGNVMEHAALNRMKMEMETASLISEVQGLLAINREIKALWIRGPLNPPGENRRREAELDKQADAVTNLFNQALAVRDNFIKAEKNTKLNAQGSSSSAAAGESSSSAAAAGAGS